MYANINKDRKVDPGLKRVYLTLLKINVGAIYQEIRTSIANNLQATFVDMAAPKDYK